MPPDLYPGLVLSGYGTSLGEALRASPGVSDPLVIGIVVFLLDASVLRCWYGIVMGLGNHPRPDFFWFIPLSVTPTVLAPNWNFFAPNPGCHDTRILIRWKLPNAITGWTESSIFRPREVTLATAFWNPSRYLKKLLIDFASGLLGEISELRSRAPTELPTARDDRVQLTVGYLGLLGIASLEPRPASASAVQFALVHTSEWASEPRMLFRSNWHSMPQAVLARDDDQSSTSFTEKRPVTEVISTSAAS